MKFKAKYSSIISVILIILVSPISIGTIGKAQTLNRPLIYARGAVIDNVEPYFAGYERHAEVIRHVAETLFSYNYGSKELYAIPLLASGFGYWDDNETELSIPLRENVEFHDGTKFNASVVSWNLDRIKYFYHTDWMGWEDLMEVENDTWVEIPGATKEYNDTEYLFILKEWEVIDEFTINITLHYENPLIYYHLCYAGFTMVSPLAHSATSPIEDGLVGTGPFKMTLLNSSGTTYFDRFEDYWNGPANISSMEWVYVESNIDRSKGILYGEYDTIKSVPWDYWENFSTAENLTFTRLPDPEFNYIGFNTKEIPVNHRKTMAYAFNYTAWYEISDTYPMYTPISPGILFSKTDMNIPYLNLSIARQYMIYADAPENDTLDDIDLGNLTINSPDSEWISRSETDPIFTYNFTHVDGGFQYYQALMFSDNMKLIGVNIELEPFSYWDLMDLVSDPDNYHKIRIFHSGWAPDYPDPHNMIANMLLDRNPMQVDDPALWNLIEQGLELYNLESRRDIYYEIQEILCEDIVPWVQLYTWETVFLHTNEINYFPYNVLGRNYFYPLDWNLPAIFGYEIYLILGISAVSIIFLRLNRKFKIS